MRLKIILFASAFLAIVAIIAFSFGLLAPHTHPAVSKHNQSSSNTPHNTQSSANTHPNTQSTGSTPHNTQSTGNTLLNTRQVMINGQTVLVLTTFNQMTLYYNSQDTASTSSCTSSSCTQAWHPLQSNGNVFVSGSYPIKGTLTTKQTANGPQVEYIDANGTAHLLYTYAGDTAPGQVNGQGQGGIWYAVPVTSAPSHW